MKKFTLTTFVLLVFSYCSLSQNISSWVVSSQSGEIVSDTILIEWTLGETFTETVHLGTIILTEGFIQPHRKILNLEQWTKKDLKIYPNPAHSILYFQTTAELSPTIEAILFDSYGRIIARELLSTRGPQMSIDVSALTSGLYFIKMCDSQANLSSTFKFIKN